MDGMLILEDGAFFRGRFFGADQARGQGEVVFNTSPTGYQEILTDPSYAAQIVVLSTAHVGNYGVNAEDVESTRLRAAWLGGGARFCDRARRRWRNKALRAHRSRVQATKFCGFMIHRYS